MREPPILMTPDNAQKCHDGTKTQTRRIVSVPSWASGDDMLKLSIQRTATGIAYYKDGMPVKRLTCPYGVVGDRLWVREPWAWPGEEAHLYKGNPSDARLADEWKKDQNYCQVKWKPSIHMPRLACRTVLEITELRVERLKDISPADALAEGVFCPEVGYAQHGERAPVLLYGFLWESIHGQDSWAQNPWVWVLTFRKVG